MKYIYAILLSALTVTFSKAQMLTPEQLKADITIVDNAVRALPLIVKEVKVGKMKTSNELESVIRKFSNKNNLRVAENHVRKFTCRKK